MLKILGGYHRSRPLLTPKTGLRPSTGMVRESLFNILYDVKEDRFLDLFSGSGAIGLEALSRGAAEVVFVEKDRKSVEVIQKNLTTLGEEGSCFTMDVKCYLESYQGDPFDVIFADPPYHKGWIHLLLPLIGSRPLLREGGLLFVEEGIEANPKGELELEFVNARRYGSSILHQWRKR